MDVHTFLLKSYVTDLLELPITSDCSVSHSALDISLSHLEILSQNGSSSFS